MHDTWQTQVDRTQGLCSPVPLIAVACLSASKAANCSDSGTALSERVKRQKCSKPASRHHWQTKRDTTARDRHLPCRMLQQHFYTGSAHQQSASACVSRPLACRCRRTQATLRAWPPAISLHCALHHNFAATPCLCSCAEVWRTGCMHCRHIANRRSWVADCPPTALPSGTCTCMPGAPLRSANRAQRIPATSSALHQVRITRPCACTAVQLAGAA